ncbi:hypothetical protein LCGC14_0087340 [marine sediment metagenome]|uniref:Uncharacterized protein n=1 Tax=marine sediment metagenome TaxID=412755 RepID=A0A0F9VGX6_9ZZZZ|nr:hypothetical protein [Halomonas sp.]HDZ46428.1 hypothetical protein [Halomonas sp.]HEB06198.1 hypothetical protein [Halomonas sp.]
MPSPCKRCTSPRTLNLNTAQRVGVVSSTLVGGAIGAWRATAMTGSLTVAVTRFPLAKLPAAMTGAVAGGQTGSRIANSLFEHWLPAGSGTPWLCLFCGYTFRDPNSPLAATS